VPKCRRGERACGTYRGEKRGAKMFGGEACKNRQLERPMSIWKCNIKKYLKKQDGILWIEVICVRAGKNGEMCTEKWAFRFHKISKIA
jgi:hypothetical protein